MGGALVPLHHEAILELLFDESNSGVFGIRIWRDVGRFGGEFLEEFGLIFGLFLGMRISNFDTGFRILGLEE